jgi:hypothetical protein
MRPHAFAALFALAACVEPTPDAHLHWSDEASPLIGDQLPPPAPPDFSLSVGNLIAGGTNLLRIQGAPPNASIRLARSTTGLGNGPCPPQLGGRCLPIRGPAALLPVTLQANSQGDVTATILLPSTLAGTHLALAALVLGPSPEVSNAVGRTVHPQGTSLPSFVDSDNDGATPADGDCNDLDPNVGPGATDALGDGFDANCDNSDGVDDDGDGFPNGPDCDDSLETTWPGATEVCDGSDNDCDGVLNEGLQCIQQQSFTVGRQVDLLFVIDDSCSMSEEQNALANNFTGRVDELVTAGVDFHLGVVSTDTDIVSQAGRLRPLGGATYLTPQSPNAEAAFTTGLLIGTNGSANERGLRASQLALTEPLRSGANAGFLRANADLHIVIVSDENDYSAGNPSPAAFAAAINALKPSPLVADLHLITGGPSGCSTADVDTEYRAAQAGLGGNFTSICGSDYSGVLDPVWDDLLLNNVGTSGASFVLASPANPATIGVVVDSPTLGVLLLSAADWTYVPATRTLTITGVPLDPGTVVTITWQP